MKDNLLVQLDDQTMLSSRMIVMLENHELLLFFLIKLLAHETGDLVQWLLAYIISKSHPKQNKQAAPIVASQMSNVIWTPFKYFDRS